MDFYGSNEGENKNETANKYKTKYFISGLVVGIIGLVSTCLAFPYVHGAFDSTVFQKTTASASGGRRAYIDQKIDNIYTLLDKYYVNDYDIDETLESLYYGIVYGVGDPYTVYMSKDVFTKFQEETEGTYAGIGVGVNIDPADNTIIVIAPFEGCPGADAGILAGDKIIKINDVDVSGDILDEAVSMMKGDPGTTVDITLFRPSENKIIEVSVTREKIDVPTVSHKMLANNVGYIKITQFDRVTYDQFALAYNDLKNSMSGLIIDLRNNPGGLLNVVTDITDMLVPSGNIVYTEDKNGDKIYTKSNANHIDVPLLILVNGNSASASEVMSGAVQDMGVGELIGTQTFGKGVVQNIFPLGDGSAVKVTIAKYYTPNGICIQGTGLTPNYEVQMDAKKIIKSAAINSDDSDKLQEAINEDIQLKRALEIMSDKIAKSSAYNNQ